MKIRPLFITLVLVVPVLFLNQCAPHNNNPVAKGYQNVTGKFNSYWYANEHILDVEQAIANKHENNYNEILKVLYPIDTAFTKTLETQLEDAYKKASLSIQRHPTSNWVYPSYVLIGKSRMYRGQYAEAIETFKYINTKSEDNDTRHEALIDLMRVFIDYDERNNAIAVSDYLKKEKLNRKNQLDLYLTRAHLYQKDEDLDQMVNSLVLAVPLITNQKQAAKIHFIIGQIYQEIGFDAEAYSNYKKCIKNNPEYELFFYARLNMAQVSDLLKTSGIKRIRKEFEKLLDDPKNKEFRDRIYYEMGQFELKQGNLDEAISHYQSSAGIQSQNNLQKAYAYLRLGEIHYERLTKYELAQAYYDSAISVLPKTESNYEQIKERAEILDSFVKQINTIQLQDSLLQLAAMDTSTLYAYLDNYIEEKELERLAEEERLKREKKKSRKNRGNTQFSDPTNPFAINDNTGNSSTWYFYNTSALAVGRTEFDRVWGNRPLEDNWRRSSKGSASPRPAVETVEASNANGESEQEIEQATSGISRESLLRTIPSTDEEKASALASIEKAFYALGNIYNFDLEEEENAVKTFEELLRRYPTTEYKAEVAYELYLIYEELGEHEKSEYYKNVVLEEFPRTSYAKILINPNYKEESSANSAKLQKFYKEAYALFREGLFKQADSVISVGLGQFEENEFTDNMEFLRVLIVGETEGIYNYQFQLEKFVSDYPESDLVDYANQMLEVSRKFQEEQTMRRGANYMETSTGKFLFVVIYEQAQYEDNFTKQVNDFISEHYADKGLNTANLILNERMAMIMINEFSTKEESMDFYRKINGENSPFLEFESLNLDNFVITNDNFQILYQTKDLNGYRNFFKENFQ